MTNSANYRLPGIGTIPRTGAAEGAAGPADQSPSGEASEETCECGHPRALHDAVASRYCAVTVAGSLTRGCVCPEPAAER